MEADAEIHNHAPGWAPGVRRDYMSKVVQDHDGEIYRDNWTKLVGTHKL